MPWHKKLDIAADIFYKQILENLSIKKTIVFRLKAILDAILTK
jgi:hypothetical protein